MGVLRKTTNQKFLNSHLEWKIFPWFTESAIIVNLILDVHIAISLISDM